MDSSKVAGIVLLLLSVIDNFAINIRPNSNDQDVIVAVNQYATITNNEWVLDTDGQIPAQVYV